MYSIDANNSLTALVETPYELEIHLQEILASHPSLLAGEQMNAAVPRRFVLASSEAGIAVSESSGNVFSLDLLFLDQDAVLTLVEVKRSSDTRIRREVIGQLLEYAANVCAFWSAAKVRAEFERTTLRQDADVASVLETSLGLDQGDYETYWKSLQANLDLQRLRLVLVADKISIDTLRIIEYLNKQMTNTDVFAVAISQFAGGSVRTLTPRVLNPSLSETDRKSSTARRGPQWSRERFYEALRPTDAVNVMRAIDDWAQSKDQVEVAFGSGMINGSLQMVFHSKPGTQGYRSGPDVVFLTLWSSGTIEIDFQFLASFGAFRESLKRSELLDRLNAVGCDIPKDKLSVRPNISWARFENSERLQQFLAVQDWVIASLGEHLMLAEV
jgi:hypothetical protein